MLLARKSFFNYLIEVNNNDFFHALEFVKFERAKILF